MQTADKNNQPELGAYRDKRANHDEEEAQGKDKADLMFLEVRAKQKFPRICDVHKLRADMVAKEAVEKAAAETVREPGAAEQRESAA